MKRLALMFALALTATPLATALAQGSLSPAIGADNTRESHQVEAGHAEQPPTGHAGNQAAAPTRDDTARPNGATPEQPDTDRAAPTK